MAIYDASQMTKKISDCDSMQSLVNRNTCYDDVKGQYEEIIKTNTDALNGTGSGTYSLKRTQEAQVAACGSDATCALNRTIELDTTKKEIAIREGRITDAKIQIGIITGKKTVINNNPKFTEELKAAKQKRNIYLIIGIIVIIGLIALGVWLYKKNKA